MSRFDPPHDSQSQHGGCGPTLLVLVATFVGGYGAYLLSHSIAIGFVAGVVIFFLFIVLIGWNNS